MYQEIEQTLILTLRTIRNGLNKLDEGDMEAVEQLDIASAVLIAVLQAEGQLREETRADADMDTDRAE